MDETREKAAALAVIGAAAQVCMHMYHVIMGKLKFKSILTVSRVSADV